MVPMLAVSTVISTITLIAIGLGKYTHQMRFGLAQLQMPKIATIELVRFANHQADYEEINVNTRVLYGIRSHQKQQYHGP